MMRLFCRTSFQTFSPVKSCQYIIFWFIEYCDFQGGEDKSPFACNNKHDNLIFKMKEVLAFYYIILPALVQKSNLQSGHKKTDNSFPFNKFQCTTHFWPSFRGTLQVSFLSLPLHPHHRIRRDRCRRRHHHHLLLQQLGRLFLRKMRRPSCGLEACTITAREQKIDLHIFHRFSFIFQYFCYTHNQFGLSTANHTSFFPIKLIFSNYMNTLV